MCTGCLPACMSWSICLVFAVRAPSWVPWGPLAPCGWSPPLSKLRQWRRQTLSAWAGRSPRSWRPRRGMWCQPAGVGCAASREWRPSTGPGSPRPGREFPCVTCKPVQKQKIQQIREKSFLDSWFLGDIFRHFSMQNACKDNNSTLLSLDYEKYSSVTICKVLSF